MSPPRRRVVVGFAGFGLFWGAWGAVLPAVRDAARADDAELGTALLMVGLGALLSMRPTGALADRRGPLVLPATVAALGAAAVVPALVGSPAALGAALLVLGAASGAVDVALNAAGAAEEAGSGPLLGAGHAAFSAAVLTAGLLTAGARALGAGPLPVLGAAAVALLLVAAELARTAGTAGRTGPAPARSAGRWRPHPALLVLGALGALAYLLENAWQNWGALHLQDSVGAAPAVAALTPAVFAACTTAGRLAGHRLAGRLTDRALLGGSAAVAAVGTLVGALAATPPAALAGVAVAGLGTAVYAPTVLSVTGRWAAPAGRAGAVATVTTLSYLGFLLGPAAVGLVAGATSLPAALAGVAGVAVVLALASAAVPRVPVVHGSGSRGAGDHPAG